MIGALVASGHDPRELLDWTWPQIQLASRCLGAHYEALLTAVFGEPKGGKKKRRKGTAKKKKGKGTAREQAEGKVPLSARQEQMARAREVMAAYSGLRIRTTKG